MKRLFGALAITSLFAAPASAYVTRTAPSGAEARWVSETPVPWYVDPAGSQHIPLPELRQTLSDAFEAWTGHECATLQLTYAGHAAKTSDGMIRVRFQHETWTGQPGAPARTELAMDPETGRIHAATIVVNAAEYTPNTQTLKTALLPYIGQALGLTSSRERDAVMFFAGRPGNAVVDAVTKVSDDVPTVAASDGTGDASGTGSPIVSAKGLGADDVRGLCYLYPASDFSDGRTCDSCQASADCVAGAECLQVEMDGSMFCAEACTTTVDCTAGTHCAEGRCVPQFGHCRRAPAAIPVSGYCWGHEMCAGGLVCAATSFDATCAVACATTTGQCAKGQSCAVTASPLTGAPGASSAGGAATSGAAGAGAAGVGSTFGVVGGATACVSPGAKAMGEVCAVSADCASLECFGGFCSAVCSSADDCAAGMACVTLEVGARCLVPGPLAIGESCGSATDCASLACTDLGRPRGPECVGLCDADLSCPEGSRCLAVSDEDLCVAPGRIHLGGSCAAPLSALDCESLQCFDFGQGATCTTECQGACASGCACDEATGLCANPTVLGQPISVELCDGLDDNCNGAIDEEYGIGQSCSSAGATCSTGVTACAGSGLGGQCVEAIECGDDDACTIDQCDGMGGCTYTAVACDDANPCTIDTCDPVQGCVNAPRAEGAVCGDGDVCSGIPTCREGLCQPGVPLSCNDGDPCTEDLCSLGQCHNLAVDGCNKPLCDGVVCDDANPCTEDTCDPALGCVHTPKSDGAVCGDNDMCNGVEICKSGVCRTGMPLNCDDGLPCTLDTCDPLAGCLTKVMADGASCDDGDLCNGIETCAAGACIEGQALTCDDGKPCTADFCNPQTGCLTVMRPDGAYCTDDDFCNGVELCVMGRCELGLAAKCDDGNVCTVDTCDPAVGCVFQPVTDDLSCADGDQCNGAEICQAGTCRSVEPLICDDGQPCTIDLCDATVGCITAAQADGAPCNDGDHCNGLETCAMGECVPSAPLDCDDGNPCTIDTCSPTHGCQHINAIDGAACGPTDPCAETRVCAAGVCEVQGPVHCDDGNLCTMDDCVPDVGCLFAVKVDCSDGNDCTLDACDPELGCSHTMRADGFECGDGDACNGVESCFGGSCQLGAPRHCDDGDECTLDSCDPNSGSCVHVTLPGCGGSSTVAPTEEPGDQTGPDYDILGEPTQAWERTETYAPFGGRPTTFVLPPPADENPGCTAGNGAQPTGWAAVLMLMMLLQYSLLLRRRKSRQLLERIKKMLSAPLNRRDEE